MIWRVTRDLEDRVVYARPGKIGRQYIVQNAFEIEKASSYNGSGPLAFGGALSWPTVTMTASFQEGERPLATKFSVALKQFVEAFLRENSK